MCFLQCQCQMPLNASTESYSVFVYPWMNKAASAGFNGIMISHFKMHLVEQLKIGHNFCCFRWYIRFLRNSVQNDNCTLNSGIYWELLSGPNSAFGISDEEYGLTTVMMLLSLDDMIYSSIADSSCRYYTEFFRSHATENHSKFRYFENGLVSKIL